MKNDEIRRLTLMTRYSDDARADIALTPERTYYRFATDTTIEDGEVAAVPDFAAAAASIVEAARPLDGETPLPAEMKVQLFVNNRLDTTPVTEQALRRMVEALQPLAAEFAFLRGFVQ